MEIMTDDKIEKIVGRTERPLEEIIWEKYKNHCGNCGGEHKLRVKLVVPVEAGGREIESNAMLICRACEMASDTAIPLPGETGARRIINFWVSRRLHDRMTNGMATSRGLKSMSQLVRYLMSSYVTDVARFDDLERYQDGTSSDVKVNVWVPMDQYETFKRLANNRGLSVTDAVKSLIQMFDEEIVVREKQ
jgi:hypothetical protein